MFRKDDKIYLQIALLPCVGQVEALTDVFVCGQPNGHYWRISSKDKQGSEL